MGRASSALQILALRTAKRLQGIRAQDFIERFGHYFARDTDALPERVQTP